MLETRLKRRTALRMLHRLRSIAHIVDRHQLTKDPELALHPVEATASSPSRPLSRTQLPRYLDYCSELLALTSKLAALHAQNLNDAVVLSAVNDIEALDLRPFTKDLAENQHPGEGRSAAPPGYGFNARWRNGRQKKVPLA